MTIVLLDNNTTNCRKAAMNETKKSNIFKKKHTERFLKNIITKALSSTISTIA